MRRSFVVVFVVFFSVELEMESVKISLERFWSLKVSTSVPGRRINS